MSNGVRYTPTFALPSEYEQQAMEARRRRRMAEMLAAQAYQPQEGGVAPIPTAAPLVQGLQAFLAARQERKAEEAAEKASQTESEYAKRLAGRLAGGYVPDFNVPAAEVPEQTELGEVTLTSQKRPAETLQQYQDRMRTAQFTSPTFDQMLARTPEQTALEPITPTARYKRSPEEALAMAETDVGMAAMKNRPMLAARLAKLLEEPKAAEFGTTPVKGKSGKYYLPSKSGKLVETDVEVPVEEMSQYEKEQIRLKEEELRLKRNRGGADERPKAPSGYRYNEAGDLEAIPGGPQDPDRERPLPAQIAVLVTQEKNKAMRFGQTQNRTRQFIESIENGELPLNKISGIDYAAQRAFDSARGVKGSPTEPYVKYYELLRFVDQQVNAILSAAKGPQTEGDALRARQQILDSPDNEKVVLSALRDLDNLWSNEIDLANAAAEDYTSEYRSKKKDGVIDLPPRR